MKQLAERITYRYSLNGIFNLVETTLRAKGIYASIVRGSGINHVIKSALKNLKDVLLEQE